MNTTRATRGGSFPTVPPRARIDRGIDSPRDRRRRGMRICIRGHNAGLLCVIYALVARTPRENKGLFSWLLLCEYL